MSILTLSLQAGLMIHVGQYKGKIFAVSAPERNMIFQILNSSAQLSGEQCEVNIVQILSLAGPIVTKKKPSSKPHFNFNFQVEEQT